MELHPPGTRARDVLRGDLRAVVDDRLVRRVLAGLGLAGLVAAGVAGYERLWLVVVLVGLPSLGILVLGVGRGRRLVLTTEGIYQLARTRVFGPECAQVSVPITRIQVVRYWTEQRRSRGSQARTTFHILQVIDDTGQGFRFTEQLMPRDQVAALRRGLEVLAIRFEARKPAADRAAAS